MAANFENAKGSKLLQEVAMKNSALNNGTIIVPVEIEKLHDNPDNAYLFGMEREDILHTAEGIKLNGFHGAIEVFDTGKGFYEIYSGHIRKYGAIEAGMKKIPCFISQMPDPAQKRRLLIGANLYGRNKIKSNNPILTGRQLAYHKATLKMENFKGDIREQLAKEFGISGSQVHKYMALTELIDPLQEIIGKGLVPFSLMYSAKTFSEADQEKLYECLMEILRDHEPLNQQEVKRCLYLVSGEAYASNQAMSVDQGAGMQKQNTVSTDQDKIVVHDEQLKIPSAAQVCMAYNHMNFGKRKIDNYYDLKNFLVNNYGKHHSYSNFIDIRYNCSPRGIRINSCDEITWNVFLDILSKKVPLSKEKPSSPSFISPSPLERTIYKLESDMSSHTDSISWSDPKEAKKIMRSLIALLEDELELVKVD